MRCLITTNHDDDLRIPIYKEEDLQHIVDAACAADAMDHCLLNIRFIDNKECCELHAQYFNDPTSTDVMSFPDGTEDPETGRMLLGDLAVCVDTAWRIAAEDPAKASEECLLYILHGLLHLLGYDDHNSEDRSAMWTEQNRILGLIGLSCGDTNAD